MAVRARRLLLLALTPALLGSPVALAASVAAPQDAAPPATEGGDATPAAPAATIAEHVAGLRTLDGFLRLHVDDDGGRVLLELPAVVDPPAALEGGGGGAAPRPLDAGTRLEAIHVSAIRTGLGSNPVGLDRGQLGATRVVRFREVGGRVLLEQRNLAFRATSEDDAERAAVAESFAGSVLWSGEIVVRDPDGRLLVDLTSFLTADLNRLAARLKSAGQGSFARDADRSVVDTRATLAFPDNCVLESILTFASDEPGGQVRATAAEPTAPSFVVHQQFVRLPDGGYEPRRFDPRVSSFAVRFRDYAAGLAEPVDRAFVQRFRLQKVNPGADRSAVIEPIVFHVDRGAPEPVRTALVEGARWWAEAFERAGFVDAFRVELMPEDAHPLDVRYNVIQWVHRATRGWSYGATVTDPRTGEILKGHVSLGSLRVRQDRLLFEGLAGTAATGTGRPDDPLELSLARIRQLSAHEVGHGLGFAHNFAASTQDRASVMDYPAPLIGVRNGRLDFSQAYDAGIGAWDVHAVNWAYREFPPGTDETAALERIVRAAEQRGMRFLSDQDARGGGAAHPHASLWDNGDDPVAALRTAIAVRRIGIDAFGPDRLHVGRPQAHLQEVFVPVYLHHRFQVDAAAKLLGGVLYRHAVNGGTLDAATPVDAASQLAALGALLDTLEPAFLDVPEGVARLLLPRPYGERRNRELFPARTGPTFDPLAAAAASADLTLAALLHPARASRLAEQPRRDPVLPGFEVVLAETIARAFRPVQRDQDVRDRGGEDPRHAAIRRTVQRVLVQRLIELAQDDAAAPDVRARTNDALRRLGSELGARRVPNTPTWHAEELASLIRRHLERPFDRPAPLRATEPVPPGSPIGGGWAPGADAGTSSPITSPWVPPPHLCECSHG